MVKRTFIGRKGFSLPELAIVLAILGVIATLAPRIFIQAYRFYYLHAAKVEIQRDARASLDEINRFLRQGISTSMTIDQDTNQPPWSRIRFRTVQGQTIKFYQSGHTLYSVNVSTTVLSRNLQYISFTYPRTDDPTILSVSMTMQKDTYEGGNKALELSIEKVRVMN